MTLTKEQQAAIAEKINSMTLPSGLGDRHNACSIAAINLALTGRLTDEIPTCMSEVVGKWVIQVQDGMPDKMRNSKKWKGLLPLAAGTGRDHEQERESIIVDWMWSVVLPYLQPVADAGKYGKEWRAMCKKRTPAATEAARVAAVAAGDGVGRPGVVRAAEAARDAAWDASEVAAGVVDRASWAARAAASAAGDPKKAWKHFDPCGLLQKLVEVGNDIA